MKEESRGSGAIVSENRGKAELARGKRNPGSPAIDFSIETQNGAGHPGR